MNALIEKLKNEGQDHEFYPTTNEIVARLVRDLREWSPEKNRWERHKRESVLDIGAGNGKVLTALQKADLGFHSLYAIEKSPILYGALPESVLVIGTAFEEQSLLSKSVDVIFSNPPYSQFIPWASKIIRESCAPSVYLVIPQRWEASEEIAAALKARKATAKVLGEFDFLNSEDRTARAKVHLLRIHIPGSADEAFEAFFDQEFAHLKERFNGAGAREGQAPNETPERKAAFAALTVGENYPEALAGLYRLELEKIQRNYQAAASLDPDLMREFGISPDTICKCLKQRLSALRMDYWNELFTQLNTLTDRLTRASRASLLETLHRHVHVDFTVSNIQAVVLWAIRNVNRFIESQLLAVYENMVDVCNVRNYKSNARVFKKDGWRYMQERDGWTHYALDFRIVCQSVGGIKVSSYSWERNENLGLREECYHFLKDLVVIGHNLGFLRESGQLCLSGGYTWKAGESETISFTGKGGKSETLFTARAFKNGNLHLKLNKKFILALNVEHGRLRGWLRDGGEAVEQLQDPAAGQFFACTAQLLPGTSFARLGAVAAPAVELDTSDTPDEEDAPAPAPAPARSEAVRTVARAKAVVEGMPGAVELAKLVRGLRGCCAEFRQTVAELAKLTGKAEWRVYQLWREYSEACSDQSALLCEFVGCKHAALGADVEALQAIVSKFGPGRGDPAEVLAWQAVEIEAPDIPAFEPVAVVEARPAPVHDLFELVA